MSSTVRGTLSETMPVRHKKAGNGTVVNRLDSVIFQTCSTESKWRPPATKRPTPASRSTPLAAAPRFRIFNRSDFLRRSPSFRLRVRGCSHSSRTRPAFHLLSSALNMTHATSVRATECRIHGARWHAYVCSASRLILHVCTTAADRVLRGGASCQFLFQSRRSDAKRESVSVASWARHRRGNARRAFFEIDRCARGH